MERLGMAWKGKAGKERKDKAKAWKDKERQGKTWEGKARKGKSKGKERQAKLGQANTR
jgi:hypothetical protein